MTTVVTAAARPDDTPLSEPVPPPTDERAPYVRAAVDAAPPLTDAQRLALTSIIRRNAIPDRRSGAT